MQSDDSSNNPLSPRAFWAGAALCGVFAVVAVLFRGIRWDETWEHAQILAGQVPYPSGHPLAVYVHNAFSLQTYLAAALLKLGVGPLILCGLRNLLFLLATMLPVYTVTALLTRSVMAGLLTTLLLLQGVMLEFDGSYPTMVWPELYSNGHIGGGVVLIALCAFLAQAHRSAWILFGLIPAIHIGQWPPFGGTLIVYALYFVYIHLSSARRARDLPPPRTLITMALIGLACTLLFYGIQRQFMVPIPTDGPFAQAGDTTAVWQGYTARHDPHRQFPPGNGQVILIGTLLLCGLGALYGRDANLRRLCGWLTLYVGGIAAAVWICMALHTWYGSEVPFLVIGWMPYRLINHIPPIALAISCALIMVRWPLRGWWILGGAVLAGLLQPLYPKFLDPTMTARYLADGAWIAFGLYGAALLAVSPLRRTDRRRVVFLALATIVPLAIYHSFGATCVVLGLFVTYLITRRAIGNPVVLHPILLLPVCLLLAGSVTLIHHQFQHRQSLPISSFEAQVAELHLPLPGTMILASPDNIRLQATTGLPVLVEATTPSLISYVPQIGPSIDAIYRDIYGYGFQIPQENTPPPTPWTTLWQQRSTAEWNALAMRYGFTHVVAPVGCPLNLKQVVAEEDYALYAVGVAEPQASE